MQSWRDLRRDADPGAQKLLPTIQQPAAFSDGVITAWCQELVSNHVPSMIHVRDSFAPGASDSVRKANFMSHTLAHTMAGTVAPALQVADADIAANLKRHMTRAKTQLFVKKRELARSLGHTNNGVECSNLDLLRILAAGLDEINVENLKNVVTLKAATRKW